MDQKPIKASCKLYWNQYLTKFNTHFNEANDRYEATLGDLSDKAVEALSELGIKVKHKEGQGSYIVAKSKYPFEPYDEDGNKLDPATFGNGTEAYAIISSYRHKLSAKFGAAPSVKRLVVTKVVPYEGASKEEAEEAAEDVL